VFIISSVFIPFAPVLPPSVLEIKTCIFSAKNLNYNVLGDVGFFALLKIMAEEEKVYVRRKVHSSKTFERKQQLTTSTAASTTTSTNSSNHAGSSQLVI